ncbi:hypothetical protein RF55_12658 [Lasius niger]|uniref:CCHC-type domain-containing protein n=1 Tax=Lasius niger TaxID=67767 RepID=A0A0J7KCH7_LASNI|nr:hypothetical protein RF55_12658 [Lasius niger]
MKTWLYELSKERISAFAVACGIDTTGTLDEIRARVRQYIDEHPGEFNSPGPAPTDVRPPPQIAVAPPTPDHSFAESEPASTNTAKTLNQIRKWGCHFDGRDPLAFLERIEELREGYGYSEDQLLRGLPELLKGDTLLWCRNNRDDWGTWEEFCRDFRLRYLPPNFQEQLEREIFERRQREGEKFANYTDAVTTLMRRAGGFARERRLERIYANMRAEYKLYIRRTDIRSLTELTTRAAEYEDLERERREEQNTARKAAASKPAVAAVYNREECCWRCKQRGHTRMNCSRPPRKFCSQCGKDGVLTKECHPPHSGPEC